MEFVLKYNLQFFAGEGEGGEKTEEATPKKLDKAREEGQVAKSSDLVSGVSLLVLFMSVKLFVGFVGENFIDAFTEIYGYIALYGNGEFGNNIAFSIFRRIIILVILISLPFYIGAVISSIILDVIQVKWKISTKALKPKFSNLNPISGFKKMISKTKLVELLKSILKLAIISYVVYDAVSDEEDIIITLYDYTLLEGLTIIGDVVIGLGIKISALFVAIGLGDLFYQKRKFKKDMRMTKQEIKEEFKQSDGDPQIKGKIRRKMQEASMKRMMQEIPNADVVITNPTHFAVAIKYDKSKSAAPIVIAKGEDFLAQRIKNIARENGVEIYEDKPLARMLYFNVDIGAEIPTELYEAVAEVLAYVYKINNNI